MTIVEVARPTGVTGGVDTHLDQNARCRAGLDRRAAGSGGVPHHRRRARQIAVLVS